MTASAVFDHPQNRVRLCSWFLVKCRLRCLQFERITTLIRTLRRSFVSNEDPRCMFLLFIEISYFLREYGFFLPACVVP